MKKSKTNLLVSVIYMLHVITSFCYAQSTKSNIDLQLFINKDTKNSDDYLLFKSAIDSCSKAEKNLYIPSGVYTISKTIELVDGVSLIGEKNATSPLQSPMNGTIIQYTGSDELFKIVGHNVTINNLSIVDKSNGQAKGGININANQRLIENTVLKQVQIYGFTGGYAFQLKAEQKGGICYSSFYDLTIRHAKIGISIESDSTSFVNSNSFFHGVISGGGFDYGLWIKGGNNNQFYGTCIEPYSTNFGHIVLERGEIACENIRIEGNKQSPEVPLIKFGKNTRNSNLNGLFSGGIISDLGNNRIELKDAKTTTFSKSSNNVFANPYFSISTNQLQIPNWDLTSSKKINFKILKAEIIDGFNVIELSLPPNTKVQLTPKQFNTKKNQFYNEITFGFYVKTNNYKSAFTTIRTPKGLATSYYHTGKNNWEFIGMNAIIDSVNNPNPTLHLINDEKDSIRFKVTVPVCNFGNEPLKNSYSNLEVQGGIINGMVSQAINELTIDENGILEIPSSTNYFELTNNKEIKKIINKDNEIIRGTVITLLFDQAGVELKPSNKLELKEAFISSKFGSITLISLGNGNWREVSRN